MFIQTESTPNPATMKFIPGKIVLPRGTADFYSLEQASVSPLASIIFSINGVCAVYLGYDFITVTKQDKEYEWKHLKPAILGVIMEHFMSGNPVMSTEVDLVQSSDSESEFFDEADILIVKAIKDLLDSRVRPAVAKDGGDITFKGYRNGTVFLSMKGSCSGCPSSSATLKHGVERLLSHFVPEVKEIQST
ncbi:NifU-like domain protein [Liberibacter crescens BT-1]|uniref:NifU-like domain protein n=1 Tax=Liberibacter crescens (strain BT-1) TaxID=1215343 RepID=L0ET69_LIBCB|nr:NifU family protein [Liberibacter crescens]AGA64147.1 NifU-like domain protein [Liberibacter crescens BT-1]AMC12415.1 iron transporter [Liberibacter crescens]